MKKKIIGLIVAVAMLIPCAFSLSACSCKDGKLSIRSKDVYALSTLSSISYLSDGTNAQAFNLLNTTSGELNKPTMISDDDVNGIKSCLSLFDNIISFGGVDQSVKENTSQDTALSGYSYEMTISTPTLSNMNLSCKLYYNELYKETTREVDGLEEEIEESTTFEGLIVYGNERFVAKGVKEFEKEGKEEEMSIEYKTYKVLDNTTLQIDNNNFVVTEFSAEADEVEYEYTFYENGRKVQDIELEYEEERGKAEVEFQIKDLTSGAPNETKYKIYAGNTKDTFIAKVTKNKKSTKINVTKQTDGTYKFVYENGFEEII